MLSFFLFQAPWGLPTRSELSHTRCPIAAVTDDGKLELLKTMCVHSSVEYMEHSFMEQRGQKSEMSLPELKSGVGSCSFWGLLGKICFFAISGFRSLASLGSISTASRGASSSLVLPASLLLSSHPLRLTPAPPTSLLEGPVCLCWTRRENPVTSQNWCRCHFCSLVVAEACHRAAQARGQGGLTPSPDGRSLRVTVQRVLTQVGGQDVLTSCGLCPGRRRRSCTRVCLCLHEQVTRRR